MKRQIRKSLGALTVLLVAAGCGDEDLTFRGGPARSPASLAVSSSEVVMRFGNSVSVGAELRDAAGNAVGQDVTLSACNSGIVTVAAGGSAAGFRNTYTLTGSGVGSTCVVASAASLADTISVVVGPDAITIAGPDSVPSGTMATFTANGLDASGAPLTGTFNTEFQSVDNSRLFLTLQGEGSGRTPGNVTVQGRADGGATATRVVTIVPGVFGGTLSATSGAGADLVTINRAADGGLGEFDSDVAVDLGGVTAYIDTRSDNQMVVAIPAMPSASAFPLTLANLGPGNFAEQTTFTFSGTPFQDKWQPNSNGPGTAPDASTIISAGGYIYLAHGGFGTGSAARGVENGGAQVDHWFAVTAGASDIDLDLTLEWQDGSDVDLEICDAGGGAGSCAGTGFSGSSSNETASGTVPAGTTMYIIVTMWSAGSNNTNMRLQVNGI